MPAEINNGSDDTPPKKKAVTVEEVEEAAKSSGLTGEEERVMTMRLGVETVRDDFKLGNKIPQDSLDQMTRRKVTEIERETLRKLKAAQTGGLGPETDSKGDLL